MSAMSQKFQDRPKFNCLAFIYQLIPILEWLPKYKWKEEVRKEENNKQSQNKAKERSKQTNKDRDKETNKQ